MKLIKGSDKVLFLIRVLSSLVLNIPYILFRLEETYRVFGAHLERKSYNDSPKEPGQVIGQRHGAILVQCGDGAVWLSHLKKNKLKLPATSWLKNSKFIPALSEPEVQLPYGTHPSRFQVINGRCVFFRFKFPRGLGNDVLRAHAPLENF